MFHSFSPFTKTRLLLSGWYTLILFLILFAFSLALSFSYANDVTRIVLRQDFGNHVPTKLSPVELRLILSQVKELRNTSRLDIIVIDIVTLLVGSMLSFFLAGKTLEPIKKSMQGQKLFIADASHELKNPVTTIQAACEVALRSSSKTKKEYKEVLTQIHEQSLRLGRLIQDLLSLSILDSGHGRSFTKCAFSHIVEKEFRVVMPLAKSSHITFSTHITPNVFIHGDEDKLSQLVVILLDNALKYTLKGGEIIIKLSARPTPQLSIEDTGIGIEQEKQQHIFQRFYQADPSHSGKGAGLGLSIAQAIMQLHKGKITVRSIPGKGSIFTCIFPNHMPKQD